VSTEYGHEPVTRRCRRLRFLSGSVRDGGTLYHYW
jgi:hypothetical protein